MLYYVYNLMALEKPIIVLINPAKHFHLGCSDSRIVIGFSKALIDKTKTTPMAIGVVFYSQSD
jgi:hypothetical protein